MMAEVKEAQRDMEKWQRKAKGDIDDIKNMQAQLTEQIREGLDKVLSSLVPLNSGMRVSVGASKSGVAPQTPGVQSGAPSPQQRMSSQI